MTPDTVEHAITLAQNAAIVFHLEHPELIVRLGYRFENTVAGLLASAGIVRHTPRCIEDTDHLCPRCAWIDAHGEGEGYDYIEILDALVELEAAHATRAA